jgi:two-component system response regulator AlgR
MAIIEWAFMKIRALIVDDEPVARSVLREELGMHSDVEIVGEANNGAVAIERIEALRPDLVFLDLKMPEMDGLAVMRRLRVLGKFPVIVVVTADEDRKDSALTLGATDYLQKPVSPSRLSGSLEAVRNILSER